MAPQLIPSSGGAFEVREAFAELSFPILRDMPFFNTLAIDGAARWSDYTTVGDTFTWKIGGTWSPVRDISFRATKAEAVRAPNIAELFQPQGQTFELIDDPCDVNLQGQGSSFRTANCATLLTALGIDPTTFTDPNSSSVAGLLRGNRTLQSGTINRRVKTQPQVVRQFRTCQFKNWIQVRNGEKAIGGV